MVEDMSQYEVMKDYFSVLCDVLIVIFSCFFFFFKQKTAYEIVM